MLQSCPSSSTRPIPRGALLNIGLGNIAALHSVLFDGGFVERDGEDGGLALGRQGGEALWKQVSYISTRVVVLESCTVVNSLLPSVSGRYALFGCVKHLEFYLALPGKGGDRFALCLCLYFFCI